MFVERSRKPNTQMPTRDIDKGWAWVVLGVAVFNLTILGTLTVSIGIFQTEFLQHFEGSTAFVSVAGSLCVAFQMLLGPVSSVLCSCLGIRWTLMIGAACLSIGIVSASFVTSLPQLIVCFGIIAGFGFGTSYTPSAIVVGHFFKEKRVLTNGIALSATGMGMMSGPHLIGWLIDQYGWRFALAVFACIVAQMVISSSLVFPLVGTTNQADQVHSKHQVLAEKSETLPLDSHATNQTNQKFISENMNDGLNEEYMQIIEKPSERNDETHQIPEICVKYVHQSSSLLDKTISNEHVTQCKDVYVETRTPAYLQETEDNSKESGFQNSCDSLKDEQYASEIQQTEDSTSTKQSRFRRTLVRLGQFIKDKFSALYVYKTKLFWLLGFHFFFQLLGYSVQIVHLPSYALSVGIVPLQFPSLFTAYGITVIITRIISGIAFNRAGRHILVAYIVMVFLMGLVVAIMPIFAHGFIELVIYQVLFAVTYGTSFTLVSPIVIDLFGVENLASVFGGMLFLGGLSYLTGPPFAGVLFDATSSYSMGFHVGGLMSLFGGVIMVPVLFIKRRRDRRRIRDKERTS